MSGLNCPVCTFGCTDQATWVSHFFKSGHRINQSLNQLWNWPLEQNRRALVVPYPSATPGGENYKNPSPDANDDLSKQQRRFYKGALNHFYQWTGGDVTVIVDFLVDTKWNAAVLLVKNRDFVEYLMKFSGNNVPGMDEPLCLKSKYCLRNSHFETMERIRLFQPGAGDNPENSCLTDIESILENLDHAPLDLSQQLLYLLENYAVTNIDIDLQETVFAELKVILMQWQPVKKVVLVHGGATHFGYKFDAINAEITVPSGQFSDLDKVVQATKVLISKSGKFEYVTCFAEPSVRDHFPLAQDILLRHVDLRILINVTITLEDDPDIFGPRLLAFLMSFDKRAVPLANFLQLWSTHRKVGLPNSTILNLVFVFLTRIGAIPSIHYLQDLSTKTNSNEGSWDFSICLDDELILDKFRQDPLISKNKTVDGFPYDAKDVLRWARNFFKFFMQNRLEDNVICLLTGTMVRRKLYQSDFEEFLPFHLKRKYLYNPSQSSKTRDLSQRLEVGDSEALVTQHPFILSRNVSAGMNKIQVKKFHDACTRDFEIMDRVIWGQWKLVDFFKFFNFQKQQLQQKKREEQAQKTALSPWMRGRLGKRTVVPPNENYEEERKKKSGRYSDTCPVPISQKSFI